MVRAAGAVIFFCGVLLPMLWLAAGDGAPHPPSAPDAAYVESFEKWEAAQIEDLKQNWLPLAGLFWLKPGGNSFGAASGNALVFPKGPARAGAFDLAGKDVTVTLLPEAHATISGKALSTAPLSADISGNPTVIEMGSLRFFVIVRGETRGDPGEGSGERGNLELSRTHVLSPRSELPGDGEVGTLQWPADNRGAQCARRRDSGAGSGHRGIQNQRPGAEADRPGRRSNEGAVVCFQRPDRKD